MFGNWLDGPSLTGGTIWKKSRFLKDSYDLS